MFELPKMDINNSETDCCPKFQPELWDEKVFELNNLLFVKIQTKSFLYIPLNMDKIMTKAMATIEEQNAKPVDTYLMLSHDVTPWKCEHYILVNKEVAGMEMTNLDGMYMTKVFEGDFKDTPEWIKQMKQYVISQGKEIKSIYSFYTTCPKCAKHYGKNYVVLFAKI